MPHIQERFRLSEGHPDFDTDTFGIRSVPHPPTAPQPAFLSEDEQPSPVGSNRLFLHRHNIGGAPHFGARHNPIPFPPRVNEQITPMTIPQTFTNIPQVPPSVPRAIPMPIQPSRGASTSAGAGAALSIPLAASGVIQTMTQLAVRGIPTLVKVIAGFARASFTGRTGALLGAGALAGGAVDLLGIFEGDPDQETLAQMVGELIESGSVLMPRANPRFDNDSPPMYFHLNLENGQMWMSFRHITGKTLSAQRRNLTTPRFRGRPRPGRRARR